MSSDLSVASGEPTIAAIIPLYNGRKYILESLQSVLAQTRPPQEIIVVDDGSTDGGADIVKTMAAEHPIRLLSKANGGQSSARNHGVAHAASEFIALLDQDDVWYPTHLEELVKPFVLRPPGAVPLGWVYSNMDEIDERGGLVQRSFLDLVKLIVAWAPEHPKRSLTHCLRGDMFVLPSASLISKAAFNHVGGFDNQLSGYEDDDLFMRMFYAGYDNVYVDKALHKWRLYSGSSSFSPRMARSRLRYARKLMQMFPDEEGRQYVRDLIVPRFLPQVVAECLKAARAGNAAVLAAHIDDLDVFAQYLSWRARLVLNFGRPLLNRPRGFLWTHTLRQKLRKLV